MIYIPSRRIIRPGDKPSFEHTQRWGLDHDDWSAQGLVLCTLFNEGGGSTAYDISGNDNHGSLVADAHFVPGRAGGTALDLDGAGDYVNRNVANWQSGDSQGTITAWIKRNVEDVSHMIFTSADESSTDFRINFYVQAGNILRVLNENDLGANHVSGQTIINSDTWYHVAFVSNGSQYFIYLNGVAESLDVSGSNNGDWFGDIPNRDNIVIGQAKDLSPGSFFNGQVGQILIHNRALSVGEIAGLKERPYRMVYCPKTMIVVPSISGIVTLTGTVAATSSVTGNLSVTKKITGTIAATSSLTGDLSVTKKITGTIAATSSLTGDLTVTGGIITLTGSIAATSSVTGSLSVTKKITGTVAATSSVTGSLSVTKKITGTVAATSSVTGSLSVTKKIIGDIAAVSAVGGSLSVTRGLTGIIAANSAVSGGIKVAWSLGGIITATSSLTGHICISSAGSILPAEWLWIQELIDEEGRSMTIAVPGCEVEAGKPWRGNELGMPTPATGVFVRYKTSQVDNDHIRRGDQKVLLAPVAAIDIEKGTKMIDSLDRSSWNVIDIQKITSKSDIILYILQVRQ